MAGSRRPSPVACVILLAAAGCHYPDVDDPGIGIELLGDGGHVAFAEALIGDRTTFTFEFWIRPYWPPTLAPHPFRNAIYAESYDGGGPLDGSVRNFIHIVDDDATAPGYVRGAMSLENWLTNVPQNVFTEPLPEDDWHHVAFVADGAELRVYVNGMLHDEGPLQPYLGATPTHFRLGHRLNPVSGDNYGRAVLDDVRVSSIARYAADFVPPRLHEVDADTLSLWRFDEPTGSTTKDASGNQPDAVLSGMVLRVYARR